MRRVAAGEVLEVTDRGRPVARLVPVPQEGGGLAGLLAAGRVTPPEGDLLELGRPLAPAGGAPPSAILEAMRADER